MRKRWQAALGACVLAAVLLAFGTPMAAWSADSGAPTDVADNLSPDSPMSHAGQSQSNPSGSGVPDTDKYNSEFHQSFQNLIPDAPPPGYSTMMGKWTTTLYGFVQIDTVYDTTNSYNNWPFNAAPAAPGVVSTTTGGTYSASQDSTLMSPRFGMDVNNSRIGFALSSPSYNGYKIRALLEMDFLANPGEGLNNGASGESNGSGLGYITNPIFRIRHFFMDVTTPSTGNVLIGQYWSLFGWQPYNIQNNLQIAPGPGTAYGRFPQIRWYKTFHMNDGWMLEPAVAVMVPPQTTGWIPSFTEGLKFADSNLMTEMMIGDTGKGQFPASIGISGIEQAYTGYNSSNVGYNSWTAAGAVDLIFPIIPVKDGKPGNNLTLQAEYTWGQGDAWQFPNLSFGGPGNGITASGTTFPGTTAFMPLDIQTYNVDLQYYFPDDAHTSLVAGFAVDNTSNLQQLVDGGLSPGTSISTNALYEYSTPDTHLTFAYVDVWHDFTPAVRAGLEYGQYDAVYTNGINATDNRIMMSWFYFF